MTRLIVDELVGGYSAHDHILKGVRFDVSAGEVAAILGPNGAGKSTLLKAIAGLLGAVKGSVSLNGEQMIGLPPRELIRRGVVLVPQEQNIFASMTIEENLEIAAFVDRGGYKVRREQVYARFPALARKRNATGKGLSGGQRQMLAMGMAMMVGPAVLMLDEPTAGLSPAVADDLFHTIRGLRSDDIAIAMVEQNALRALEFSDRAFILVDGRNSRDGSAQAFLADSNFKRSFLGQD